MSGKHLVGRQVFKVSVSDKEEANLIFNKLGEITSRLLQPMMAELMNEFSSEEATFRIDRIVIDLGKIHPEELETTFVQRFKTAFQRSLQEQLGVEKKKPDQVPPQAIKLELLAYLLKKGTFPWWATKESQVSLNTLLAGVLSKDGAVLKTKLRELLTHSGVRKRLALQCSTTNLAKLCEIYWGRPWLRRYQLVGVLSRSKAAVNREQLFRTLLVESLPLGSSRSSGLVSKQYWREQFVKFLTEKFPLPEGNWEVKIAEAENEFPVRASKKRGQEAEFNQLMTFFRSNASADRNMPEVEQQRLSRLLKANPKTLLSLLQKFGASAFGAKRLIEINSYQGLLALNQAIWKERWPRILKLMVLSVDLHGRLGIGSNYSGKASPGDSWHRIRANGTNKAIQSEVFQLWLQSGKLNSTSVKRVGIELLKRVVANQMILRKEKGAWTAIMVDRCEELGKLLDLPPSTLFRKIGLPDFSLNTIEATRKTTHKKQDKRPASMPEAEQDRLLLLYLQKGNLAASEWSYSQNQLEGYLVKRLAKDSKHFKAALYDLLRNPAVKKRIHNQLGWVALEAVHQWLWGIYWPKLAERIGDLEWLFIEATSNQFSIEFIKRAALERWLDDFMVNKITAIDWQSSTVQILDLVSGESGIAKKDYYAQLRTKLEKTTGKSSFNSDLGTLLEKVLATEDGSLFESNRPAKGIELYRFFLLKGYLPAAAPIKNLEQLELLIQERIRNKDIVLLRMLLSLLAQEHARKRFINSASLETILPLLRWLVGSEILMIATDRGKPATLTDSSEKNEIASSSLVVRENLKALLFAFDIFSVSKLQLQIGQTEYWRISADYLLKKLTATESHVSTLGALLLQWIKRLAESSGHQWSTLLPVLLAELAAVHQVKPADKLLQADQPEEIGTLKAGHLDSTSSQQIISGDEHEDGIASYRLESGGDNILEQAGQGDTDDKVGQSDKSAELSGSNQPDESMNKTEVSREKKVQSSDEHARETNLPKEEHGQDSSDSADLPRDISTKELRLQSEKHQEITGDQAPPIPQQIQTERVVELQQLLEALLELGVYDQDIADEKMAFATLKSESATRLGESGATAQAEIPQKKLPDIYFIKQWKSLLWEGKSPSENKRTGSIKWAKEKELKRMVKAPEEVWQQFTNLLHENPAALNRLINLYTVTALSPLMLRLAGQAGKTLLKLEKKLVELSLSERLYPQKKYAEEQLRRYSLTVLLAAAAGGEVSIDHWVTEVLSRIGAEKGLSSKVLAKRLLSDNRKFARQQALKMNLSSIANEFSPEELQLIVAELAKENKAFRGLSEADKNSKFLLAAINEQLNGGTIAWYDPAGQTLDQLVEKAARNDVTALLENLRTSKSGIKKVLPFISETSLQLIVNNRLEAYGDLVLLMLEVIAGLKEKGELVSSKLTKLMVWQSVLEVLVTQKTFSSSSLVDQILVKWQALSGEENSGFIPSMVSLVANQARAGNVKYYSLNRILQQAKEATEEPVDLVQGVAIRPEEISFPVEPDLGKTNDRVSSEKAAAKLQAQTVKERISEEFKLLHYFFVYGAFPDQARRLSKTAFHRWQSDLLQRHPKLSRRLYRLLAAGGRKTRQHILQHSSPKNLSILFNLLFGSNYLQYLSLCDDLKQILPHSSFKVQWATIEKEGQHILLEQLGSTTTQWQINKLMHALLKAIASRESIPWPNLFSGCLEAVKTADLNLNLNWESMMEEIRDDENQRAPSDGPHQLDDAIWIGNSGLIILSAFLPRYFSTLGMVEEGAFVDEEAAARASLLLQYLVTGNSEAPEHHLAFNKVLCGLPIHTPVPTEIQLTELEIETSSSLLNAVKQHWVQMENSSLENLRGSFLLREGILVERAESWELKVERKGFDVLLSFLPWTISVVKLPWLEKRIETDWSSTIG